MSNVVWASGGDSINAAYLENRVACIAGLPEHTRGGSYKNMPAALPLLLIS